MSALSGRAAERLHEIPRVLWIILGLNPAVAVAKLFYAIVRAPSA